jgi:hypothetical protein
MKAQLQHYPAPWRFRFGDIVADDGKLVCQFFSNPLNANLIRTAPELLAALKALVADCEQGAAEAGDTDTAWLDAARAAIVKAELIDINTSTH